MDASRRRLLRGLTAGLAAPALPGAGTFGLSLAGMAALAARPAQAADAAGYRALVCLFLNGGNDSHNWLVPIDATGYAQYAAVRRDLAWPLEKLVPIASTRQAAGRAFAMPLELDPLRRWYDAGHAAFVANVGPLVRPVSKADFNTGVGLPVKLFSHNDQQSTWQSLFPEGAPSGWGGRIADMLVAANPYPVFTAITATGNAVFLAGRKVTPYQVGPAGPVAVNAMNAAWTFGSPVLKPILARGIARSDGADPYEAEYARVMRRSLDTGADLGAALARQPVPALPVLPVSLGSSAGVTLSTDSLARQLRMVAQLIAAGQGLGMRRQVFMVALGGFDSHANQLRDQPTLMARVALATDWFLQTMNGLGMLDRVTLFSASDFGRTLTSNGDGCDHGWGSHHFVAGGAVRGRDIYGRFPVTALGTPEDVGSGRLLPSTSVTELAATLGGWMGLSPGELRDVLPNLGAFASPSLGFV